MAAIIPSGRFSPRTACHAIIRGPALVFTFNQGACDAAHIGHSGARGEPCDFGGVVPPGPSRGKGRRGGRLPADLRRQDPPGLARQQQDRPRHRRTLGRRGRRHRRQPGHARQRRHHHHRQAVRRLRGRARDEQRLRPRQRPVPPQHRARPGLPGHDRLSRRRQPDGHLRRGALRRHPRAELQLQRQAVGDRRK